VVAEQRSRVDIAACDFRMPSEDFLRPVQRAVPHRFIDEFVLEILGIGLVTRHGRIIIARASDDYYARLHVGAKSHFCANRWHRPKCGSTAPPREGTDRPIVQIARIRELRGEELVLPDGVRVTVSRGGARPSRTGCAAPSTMDRSSLTA
jgi:hypothetical protein